MDKSGRQSDSGFILSVQEPRVSELAECRTRQLGERRLLLKTTAELIISIVCIGLRRRHLVMYTLFHKIVQEHPEEAYGRGQSNV